MFRCLHAGRWAPRPIDVRLAEVAHLVEVDLEEGDHEADLAVLRALLQRERSAKIKLKIKKTCFENQINTILKIKDLAAKIKSFSSQN